MKHAMVHEHAERQDETGGKREERLVREASERGGEQSREAPLQPAGEGKAGEEKVEEKEEERSGDARGKEEKKKDRGGEGRGAEESRGVEVDKDEGEKEEEESVTEEEGGEERADEEEGDEEEAFSYELKIPHERVAVLIGKKGSVKKRIEKELGVRLRIDSREGDVIIEGKDPLKLYTAREIVRAIGRGFNPDIAFDLLKQDYVLEVIPITDYARTRNALVRLRGRVIGEHGRSRRTIENMTNTHVSVYGKTVGIIGRIDDVSMARRAVEMLLGQAQHAPVYKMLEKYRAEQRRREALWLSEEDELREALREEFKDDTNA